MDIIKTDKYGQINHILVQDHIPNPAFINEFQTNYFNLKLHSIEMIENTLEGYKVDDGGMYLLLHVSIRNTTNEILDLYREDFLLSYDDVDGYPAEENFKVPYQFPDEYALKPLETKKGCLIFIVDTNAKKIMFYHNEYFDEERYKTYRLRYRF